jgi:hypothetical protein
MSAFCNMIYVVCTEKKELQKGMDSANTNVFAFLASSDERKDVSGVCATERQGKDHFDPFVPEHDFTCVSSKSAFFDKLKLVTERVQADDTFIVVLSSPTVPIPDSPEPECEIDPMLLNCPWTSDGYYDGGDVRFVKLLRSKGCINKQALIEERQHIKRNWELLQAKLLIKYNVSLDFISYVTQHPRPTPTPAGTNLLRAIEAHDRSDLLLHEFYNRYAGACVVLAACHAQVLAILDEWAVHDF